MCLPCPGEPSGDIEFLRRMKLTSWYTAVAVAVGAVLYGGIGWDHQFVFRPEDMEFIAQSSVAQSAYESETGIANASRTIDLVIEGLRKTYPKYISDTPRWMFNNAGGAMGSMLILHFSLSEYVIVFGTAVGTEGHSGRFLADDYFTILHGEQWAYEAGSIEREVFTPGQMHHMPSGTCKQYRMPGECWALEYARGNVISMLPFGLGDTLTSTMDFVTLYQTLDVSVRGVVSNLLRGKV